MLRWLIMGGVGTEHYIGIRRIVSVGVGQSIQGERV